MTDDMIRSQEYALFEPGCRHVAQDIMGTNRANPAAMILSATMMLRHLGYVWVEEIILSKHLLIFSIIITVLTTLQTTLQAQPLTSSTLVKFALLTWEVSFISIQNPMLSCRSLRT